MDPTTESSQDCLCLLCRKTGHVVQKCPHYDDTPDEQGPDSPSTPDIESPCPSPPFDLFPTTKGPDAQTHCTRCTNLDALSRIPSLCPLIPADLDDTDKGMRRSSRKALQIPSLGPIPSLRLLTTCPLCRFIFNTSDLLAGHDMGVPDGGELVMVPASTIHRLEPDLYWKERGKINGPYANCVYTSVTTEWFHAGTYQPQRLVDEALDAFGIIDGGESGQDGGPALGIKRVDQTMPDYKTIKSWLRRCDNLHHITCRPLLSESLKQITLVDVESRRIIAYPPAGCDYVALSYVWGCVEQPNYKLGEKLRTVPATLEDAMSVTRSLGQRYFWADSLCIDQESRAEQVAFMSAIYSGAWATIICLSGRSASSGLPRVGTLQDVVPQLSCEIGGKRLLSVMPTLKQQILWSHWGSRAWTYQEGLLSPRRLFFTNHQVYFECNSVQCCESLDDSNSPFHLLSDDQRLAVLDVVVRDDSEQDWDKSKEAGPQGVVGRGVSRDPFRPISNDDEAQIDNDDFATYLRLVCEYTGRKMTRETDSLDAFSAILTRLEERFYKKGFVQGLPVEELPRALAWYHLKPPCRRDAFPAWTWAGWEGRLVMPIPGTRDPDEAIMPPMRIWKAGKDGHPELIYGFDPTPVIITELKERLEEEGYSDDGEEHEPQDEDSSSDSESGRASIRMDIDSPEEINHESDPISRLARTMFEKVPEALPVVGGNELLIEGIVVRLRLAEHLYCSDSEGSDEAVELCFVHVNGEDEPQRLRLYGHDAEALANQKSDDEQEFLLLCREHQGSARMVYNALLLIDRDGDMASRVGLASLRLDNVEMLDSLKPEIKLFKLS